MTSWSDSNYCPKNQGAHEVYFTDFGGRDVCRCGATRGPREAPDVPRTTTGVAHPSTSKTAGLRALPGSGTQRARVLQLLQSVYPEGRTDEEMQGELQLLLQSQIPRRRELVEQGWIEASSETRKTRTGADAIVWKYVP